MASRLPRCRLPSAALLQAPAAHRLAAATLHLPRRPTAAHFPASHRLAATPLRLGAPPRRPTTTSPAAFRPTAAQGNGDPDWVWYSSTRDCETRTVMNVFMKLDVHFHFPDGSVTSTSPPAGGSPGGGSGGPGSGSPFAGIVQTAVMSEKIVKFLMYSARFLLFCSWIASRMKFYRGWIDLTETASKAATPYVESYGKKVLENFTKWAASGGPFGGLPF